MCIYEFNLFCLKLSFSGHKPLLYTAGSDYAIYITFGLKRSFQSAYCCYIVQPATIHYMLSQTKFTNRVPLVQQTEGSGTVYFLSIEVLSLHTAGLLHSGLRYIISYLK